jgi:hypothetical protein
MVVLGIFWRDAIDQMIDLQFDLVERGNATVTPAFSRMCSPLSISHHRPSTMPSSDGGRAMVLNRKLKLGHAELTAQFRVHYDSAVTANVDALIEQKTSQSRKLSPDELSSRPRWTQIPILGSSIACFARILPLTVGNRTWRHRSRLSVKVRRAGLILLFALSRNALGSLLRPPESRHLQQHGR